MRGRKPKPTALKLLEGTRADRINHAEPTYPAGGVDPPAWLEGEAVLLWAELAPDLASAGLLTRVDRPALAALCDAYRRWRTDPLDKGAHSLYLRLLTEFGLTPSSRSRIKATAEKPADAFAEFLNRRKAK